MKKSRSSYGPGKACFKGILIYLLAALVLTACAAVSGGGVQARPQGTESVSPVENEQKDSPHAGPAQQASSQSEPAQPASPHAGLSQPDFRETDSSRQDPVQSVSPDTDSFRQDSITPASSETDAPRPETPGPASSRENLPKTGIPSGFDPAAVPEFTGRAWADVNEDVPFFTLTEMEAARQTVKDGGTFQLYGELDGNGRCSGACALVGRETLPQEGRENIRMIKPAGWHTVKYDGIDGNYLYNRCHLIGFQLTGQNANEKNLITGTRFMNTEGMLPFEDSVLAYVQGTGKHVLYRVTPVYSEKNLLADGVLMEASSIEDPLVQFCAFCYNVQPGVMIDYRTGESEGPVFAGAEGGSALNPGTVSADRPETEQKDQSEPVSGRHRDYIVNVMTGIFHFPSCESAGKISARNRQGFAGTREELIEMGYRPCGYCRP